jgi:hypothetical protein
MNNFITLLTREKILVSLNKNLSTLLSTLGLLSNDKDVLAKSYYKLIQEGALFLKFIQNDLNEMKKKQVNRHMRRRFEKSLEEFKLNEETLQYYQVKIDSILNYINGQLNPPKKQKVSGYQPKPSKQTTPKPLLVST